MGNQEVFVLSREDNLHLIMQTFCDCFGVEMRGEGDKICIENAICRAEISVFGVWMGDDDKNLVENQKNMVCGYYAQIRDCDEDIKVNLIHHMQQCSTLIHIIMESKSEDSGENGVWPGITYVLDFMKKIDGVLLVNGAEKVLNAEGRVILSNEGTSQLDYYFPFEYVDNPPLLEDCTEAQLARRNENMKQLFDNHIFVIELPVNDDDDNVTIRTKEEVVKRMFGTLAVSLYSEAMLNPQEDMRPKEARRFVKDVIKDYGISNIEDILSPNELTYFNDNKSDEETRIDFSWHYEHLYLLEWALGLDGWTEMTDICDVPKSVRVLREIGTYEELLKAVKLRSKKEILDKADLVYRMDWACVDARIHGMRSPGGLVPGVVSARHKTLNWLINFMEEDWDDVDIPT